MHNLLFTAAAFLCLHVGLVSAPQQVTRLFCYDHKVFTNYNTNIIVLWEVEKGATVSSLLNYVTADVQVVQYERSQPDPTGKRDHFILFENENFAEMYDLKKMI